MSKEDGTCWVPSTFGWKINSVWSCPQCGKLYAKRIRTAASGKVYTDWVEVSWHAQFRSS